MLEEDGTEIHNDDYLFSLENHTKLMVMDLTDTWVVASLTAQGIKNVAVPGKDNKVQILILNNIKV